MTRADRITMKRMGYTVRVRYQIERNKVTFVKYFNNESEAERFTQDAAENNIHPIEWDELA